MTEDLIHLIKQDSGYYVEFHNGVYIGEFLTLEDGYYYYWPVQDKGGCWAAYVMRAIADKLDELNKPLDDDTKAYFEKETK